MTERLAIINILQKHHADLAIKIDTSIPRVYGPDPIYIRMHDGKYVGYGPMTYFGVYANEYTTVDIEEYLSKAMQP